MCIRDEERNAVTMAVFSENSCTFFTKDKNGNDSGQSCEFSLGKLNAIVKRMKEMCMESRKEQMEQYGCIWKGVSIGICADCAKYGPEPGHCKAHHPKVINDFVTRTDYCKDFAPKKKEVQND